MAARSGAGGGDRRSVMGEWDGLSPRARAFSVAALLQLTEVTGHRSGTRCCPATGDGEGLAVSGERFNQQSSASHMRCLVLSVSIGYQVIFMHG